MNKYYEMFNTNLENLINDLIQTFPNDNDFKLFKGSFRLLKIASTKKPLELFNIGLTDEYKENIRDRNEVFFLNNDYSDVLNNSELRNQDSNNNVSDKLIKKLKSYWKDLNEENKDIVWNYFTILLKLCDKVFSE